MFATLINLYCYYFCFKSSTTKEYIPLLDPVLYQSIPLFSALFDSKYIAIHPILCMEMANPFDDPNIINSKENNDPIYWIYNTKIAQNDFNIFWFLSLITKYFTCIDNILFYLFIYFFFFFRLFFCSCESLPVVYTSRPSSCIWTHSVLFFMAIKYVRNP